MRCLTLKKFNLRKSLTCPEVKTQQVTLKKKEGKQTLTGYKLGFLFACLFDILRHSEVTQTWQLTTAGAFFRESLW